MPPVAQPRITPEEYLRRERASEHRSELVNGHVYAMGGASHEHNLLVFNLAREVGNQLRGRPFEAYVNDMRVKVAATGLYTYPDLVALCEPPRFEDHHGDTLLNPSVVVEVLSDSTEKYDRGEKFAHYRRLESLREYVLASQKLPRVEMYVRHGEQWVFFEVSGLDASFEIDSLGCTLKLADLYERISFTAADGS